MYTLGIEHNTVITPQYKTLWTQIPSTDITSKKYPPWLQLNFGIYIGMLILMPYSVRVQNSINIVTIYYYRNKVSLVWNVMHYSVWINYSGLLRQMWSSDPNAWLPQGTPTTDPPWAWARPRQATTHSNHSKNQNRTGILIVSDAINIMFYS